ncbi:MAG: dTDP-glucose 4,6-dehydratase [Coxiellaceae bacterium]|nr:dTDP-glucose 4,6-dehydratase [Coxiellaceae bacterium]|tara:strand:+ start:1260 stop:2270 length:1011 start_codon:yes stop_codon:yes gene_type:complete
MSFQPKNILVTGAAGFIGCNFVRMIFNKYIDIRMISYDKLTYAGSLDNLHDVMNNSRHVFVQGDICNRQLVGKTLREHAIDTIVHFAAESHVDNSIAGPEVFFQTNVMGTLSLIDEARKYWQDEMGWDEKQCRFHHVSTDEVYGTLSKDDPAFTEETPYAPNSPYSASKAASDHIVRSYFHTYKLPMTMSNCSNNYGPYQHQEKLIPVIMQACIDQNPIPIYGDGSNIRDWLHVDDHCNAVDLIVRQGKIGETYNIGGDNELSNLELAKKICQQMDDVNSENKPHETLINFVEDRKGHDWRYAIDTSKICKELGWKPAQDFKALLKNTVEFSLEVV